MTPELRIAIEERLKEFEPALSPEDLRAMMMGPRLLAALVTVCHEYARDMDIDAREVFDSVNTVMRDAGMRDARWPRGLEDGEVDEFHAIARGKP